MSSNRFGTHFSITTWGESHGKAIGVVIDGCPAGLPLSEEDINQALERRRPGNLGTSQRSEKDLCEIYSGVFDGVTTGHPISIILFNHDHQSTDYETTKHLYRPGHANYTYLSKYGVFDYRGGGRSSGRETACRVAAGAVAKKWLSILGIETYAYLKAVGSVSCDEVDVDYLKTSSLFAPSEEMEKRIQHELNASLNSGDSLGGIVHLSILNLPIGLGDPVYEKLEAQLASAMLSIPGSKGFEIGEGFGCARMKGSQHNDSFILSRDQITLKTNHSGGTLGGISTGMPLEVNVVFKPTSSIGQSQETVSTDLKPATITTKSPLRHDPAIAIRATPVVEAMGNLVIVDRLLANRLAQIKLFS